MFQNYRSDGGVDCPDCGKIYTYEDLADRHACSDYGNELIVECECDREFTVDVEATPQFSVADD